MRADWRDESVLTKHNFDKTPLPLEAPAFESVIIIYAFAKAPKQLKTNEYIGVRPEEIGSYLATRQFRKNDSIAAGNFSN
jgi:hypothetical protein